MRRREFLEAALCTGVLSVSRAARAFAGAAAPSPQPMALGLVIAPKGDPQADIARVKDLGIPTCFLSLDAYIGKFNQALAQQMQGVLHQYGITPTAAEVVGPGKLVWDFMSGPATIGVVPRATRAARMDALKRTSDFAKMLGIPNIQTHCGFIPENPGDPLYEEVVLAIRELAEHCAGNQQWFLMETGQETPTTVARTIKDVDKPNLGVGLDTANLILYGKANPVDAVNILGPHVRSVHAKDGKWPVNPNLLGEEVIIGTGLVDFKQVFTKLKQLGYRGAISIERETSGPKQIEDVRQEKTYLERVLSQI
jgi:L-ribulose-5-phosphate 3-epimerase